MITPDDLLALADELANANKSMYRAAIGRAYYAAFHALKHYAISQHHFTATEGVQPIWRCHNFLWINVTKALAK